MITCAVTNVLEALFLCKSVTRSLMMGLLQMCYFCCSLYYLSEEHIFMCHIKRATIRGLWMSMKDNEEHRDGALFRQKKGSAAILDFTVWHFRCTPSTCLYIIPLYFQRLFCGWSYSRLSVLKLTCCAEMCIFTLFIGCTHATGTYSLLSSLWRLSCAHNGGRQRQSLSRTGNLPHL